MKRASKKQKAINAEVNKVLFDDFDKFDSFVKRRWKDMIYASIGVILVVAIIFFAYSKKEDSNKDAQNILASASTIDELNKAIETYSKYQEANYARIVLARMYVQEKNYEQAILQLDEVIKNTTIKEQKERVLLEQAYLIEDNKDYDVAIEKFAAIGANKELASIVRAEALYGAARLAFAQNKSDLATSYLQEIEIIYPKSDNANLNIWTALARSLNSIIESKTK